jgi:Phage Tail Collar Domain
MADDRPAYSPEEEIAELKRQLEELKNTVTYNSIRFPVGTIQPTFLSVQPKDCLFLRGQTVTRTVHPNLWRWASEHDLVGVAGLKPFGQGDGSTTFQLPDFRGRVLRGVISSPSNRVQIVGEVVGSDFTNQLITHDHGWSMGTTGNHNGHRFSWWNNLTFGGSGDALMGGPTEFIGNHAHSIDITDTGNVTSMDMRQESIGVEWIIWA